MSWSAAVMVAVHTELLALIDADGASAYLEIYDASQVLLSTLPLEYPAGTINPTTGQLTCLFGDRDDAASATGTASFAKLKTAAGTTLEDYIPCMLGSISNAGYIALSSLSIIIDAPVEGVSFTVG